MIELVDTVVADVTVRSAQRAKDEACFTEFHPANLRRVYLLHCPIEYTRSFGSSFVLLRHLGALESPDSAWNYSRVRHCGAEQEKINDGLTRKHGIHHHLPVDVPFKEKLTRLACGKLTSVVSISKMTSGMLIRQKVPNRA